MNLLYNQRKFTSKKTEENIVGYFNHFRKDCIRPYELAQNDHSFDSAILSRRLNNFNCEFYLWPQVATSEFAETVTKNLHYIEENQDILDPKSIEGFVKKKAKKLRYT